MTDIARDVGGAVGLFVHPQGDSIFIWADSQELIYKYVFGTAYDTATLQSPATTPVTSGLSPQGLTLGGI